MKLTDAEIDEIATQPCSATGRRKKELAIEVKELREALKAAKTAGAYEAGLASGGAIAEMVATNTRLQSEIERVAHELSLARIAQREVNGVLAEQVAANTPLRARVAALEKQLSEGKDVFAAPCVCGHTLGVHALRQGVIACEIPGCACGPGCIHEGFIAAVTGTTSDKSPIRQLDLELDEMLDEIGRGLGCTPYLDGGAIRKAEEALSKLRARLTSAETR